MGRKLLQEELDRIKKNKFDPTNTIGKYTEKNPRGVSRFEQGIVVDNKDPDKMGRLKVHLSIWGDSVITGWIPVAMLYASKDQGTFALPDVGARVCCMFVDDDPSKPVVVGTFYNPQVKAPDATPEQKIYTTPSGSIIRIDDTKDKEEIVVMMHAGKMRMTLNTKNGIELVNEEGDIDLSCKELTMESEEMWLTSEKTLGITAESVNFDVKKNIMLKSGKDVTVKGKKIDLKGSSGVLAANKQIAAKDDQVIGLDTHIEMVPAPPAPPVPTPFPNPYIGKLADKLSKDVNIKGKAAAVQGSKSKANGPGHILIPPGAQFQKKPSNEGVVSLGCVPTVKINGKAAAVLGAKVKTCNDPMDLETCSIIAVGIPAFGFINTREPEAKKNKEEKKNKKLMSPQWNPAKASVGDEVTLSVSTQNVNELATIVFSIFKDGANPEKDKPLYRLYGRNEGGKAQAKWMAPPFEEKIKAKADEPDATIVYPPDTILGIKERLKKLGYYNGMIDTENDYAFTQAVMKFQKKYRLPQNGIPGNDTQKRLDTLYQMKNKKKLEVKKDEKDNTKQEKYFFEASTFDCQKIKSQSITVDLPWLELELKKQDGKPVANEEYVLTLPDGKTVIGYLDKNGYAKIRVPNKDKCKVVFTNYPGADWRKR